MGSDVNLAVSSFTLTPALGTSFRPNRQQIFGLTVGTAAGTVSNGTVTINTDGTVVFTATFTGATYDPLPVNLSVQYPAI